MRKMIAMGLCLCLLLSGCGGNETTPGSTTVAENFAASVSAETSAAEVAAEPSVHEDGGPTDPVELAKWVWAMADEASEAAFAYDFDLSMLMEIDVAGEYTATQSSIRTKEIQTEAGSIIYSSSTSDSLSAEEWYADGMYYQISDLGSFKTPMTQEEYDAQEEQQTSSSTVTDLYPENFGKLFATRNDNGYSVNFSEPTLETWMAFAGMFTSEDQKSATCQDFNLEGFMQVDPDGNVTQLKLEMQVTLDIMGIATSMQITVNQLTMGYNEEVVIDVPDEDDSFVELSDLSIPALVLISQTMAKSMPALSYQAAWTMTLLDEYSAEAVVQINDISYSTDEDGLSMLWTYVENINGEDTYASEETYQNGQGLIVDSEGEFSYSLTDQDVLEIISETVCLYAHTFPQGYDFVTGEDSGYATLNYSIRQDYVESHVLSCLESYSVNHLMTEGTVLNCSGNTTLWFDSTGMMASQLNTFVVNVEIEGVSTEITIQEACDIVSIGEPVILE